jgi:hypothetical protein
MLAINVSMLVHAPSTQASPSWQAVPHAPQFQKSLRKSAQPFPHALTLPQLARQVAWAQI